MEELTLIQKIAVWIIPVVFAITLHEVAHGWVADRFGDRTARFAGRLTLNPLKHVDFIGTVILPILLLMISPVIFGWAKPVPVDARNLRHPKRDMAFVAFAGPLSNMVMAIFWAVIAKLGTSLLGVNAWAWLGLPLSYMGKAGMIINLVLFILNLIPIPPLDGARVVENLLPNRAAYYMHRFEPYGLLVLLILLVTGVIGRLIFPIIFYLYALIQGIFGIM